MMQLDLSRYVEGDLDNIADYIAQDNPRRAVTFIQDIRRKLFDIQRNPLIHQLRPDIGGEARMATIGNYVILFRIMGEVARHDESLQPCSTFSAPVSAAPRIEGRVDIQKTVVSRPNFAKIICQ